MNNTVLAALAKTGDQAESQRIKDAHAALQHQLSTQSCSQAILEALVICGESAVKVCPCPMLSASASKYIRTNQAGAAFSDPCHFADLCCSADPCCAQSHNLDVAKKCLETYFLEARRCGSVMCKY